MVSETQNAPDASVQKVEREPARSANSMPKWQLPLLLIVVPLLLLALYCKFTYSGLINTEAFDYAQLGHNISAGRGMVTYVLRPLALTHGADALRQPDMTHGPLYPFVLALAFGARGAQDTVVSGVSALFYLLTVPLLYMLGLRVFNRNIGLMAAIAFACSSLMLQYAVSGLPITLTMFLVTALFLALYNLSAGKAGQTEQPEARPSTKLLVLVGVLSGLLYLVDPIFVWMLPVVCYAVSRICGPKQRGAVVKFAVTLGIVILPWMVRNLQVSGNPVFGLRGAELWMFTAHHYPGRLGYALDGDEFARGSYLFPAVFKKMLQALSSVMQALPQIANAWILAFMMPCLLFGYSSRSATMLRQVTVWSALALLVGMLLFHIEMTLFCALVPTMLIFSIAYLSHLFRQAQTSKVVRGAAVALLSLTVIYPLISQMFLEEKMHGLGEATSAKAMQNMVNPQEEVLSDMPEVVAWYADRPAILLPGTDAKVAALREQFPGTRWLFLSPVTRGQSEAWQALYDQCAHWNFAYAQAMATNTEPPAPKRISSTVQALTGFAPVAPVQNASLTTVVAGLSEAKLSLGSEPGRQTAP